MNVLIVGQLPPPVHGSNVMTKLFMETIQKLGHKVAIIEKKFSRKQEQVGTLNIIKVAKVPCLMLKFVLQIIKNRPDICFYFISVRSFSFLFDAVLIALLRLFNIEYILYCHGKGFIELEKNSGLFMRCTAKFVLKNALGGLVLGESLKQDLNHHIPDSKLFILPNAIPDIPPDKKKLDQPRPVQILYLSNLIPSKGAIEFIKMAGLVRRDRPDVKFIFAGNFRNKDFMHKVNECIDENQLRTSMVIPGAVYGQDKEKLFHESDIFVFPTHWEAFGLVNLEAMRSSLPVISTHEGAIPEVILDGITGFIVNPYDTTLMANRVLKLVNDQPLRIAMGEAARKRFEEYYTIDSYENNLKEALRFFSLLLQEKNNTA